MTNCIDPTTINYEIFKNEFFPIEKESNDDQSRIYFDEKILICLGFVMFSLQNKSKKTQKFFILKNKLQNMFL